MDKIERRIRDVMLLGILLAVLLCACGKEGREDDTVGKDVQSESQMTVELYLPIIADNDMEEAVFSFIYLDEDGLPELVAFDRYYEKYSIYTIRSGTVECLVDAMTTVEMTYHERKNVIVAFSRWNGGGDEGGYASACYQLDQYEEALTDDAVPSFQYSYQAVYDENGEWTGTGVTSYYEEGREIDETAYHQLEAAFDIALSEPLSCFSEGNQSFTKDEIMAYIHTLE